MAYYPMLTDDELIRHIRTMYQPSELEVELASRLEKLLDEADDDSSMTGRYKRCDC